MPSINRLALFVLNIKQFDDQLKAKSLDTVEVLVVSTKAFDVTILHFRVIWVKHWVDF